MAALLLASCSSDSDSQDSTATTAAPATSAPGSAPPDDTVASETTAGSTTGSSTPSSASTAPATTAAGSGDQCTADKVGGELTAGSFSFTRGLDPIVALGRGNAGGTENTAFYDTLMRYDPESETIVPRMAESLESNADFTEWTLKLRSGVKFGNGDPVTADAVKFSVERLAASTVGSSAQAKEVASATVVDPLTITFTLRRPWKGFDYFFTSEGGMVVNPAVVAAKGEAFSADPTGAGAGPFELVRLVPNDELVLKAKPDYWGGPVCVEQLRFINVPGGQATYDAFTNGELQVMYTQDPRVNAAIEADGTDHYFSLVPASNSLLLNNGVKGSTTPTSDVRLRQAIAHAIDPAAMNDRLFDGKGIPLTALFDGMEGPAYDPAEARRLVDEVKADGWDGSIRVLCNNTPEFTDFSISVQAQLEAVGMTVQRENLSQADTNTKLLVQPDYDIGCTGLSTPLVGAISSLNQWESTSPRNRAGYATPEMDAALTAFMAEESDATREALQKVWNDTVPSALLFADRWFQSWDETVHGMQFTRDSIALYDKVYVE